MLVLVLVLVRSIASTSTAMLSTRVSGDGYIETQMSTLPRHRALALLDQCSGEHVWSPEHCAQRGVPAIWVEELADAHESGFRSDSQTLYTDQGVTNQYYGVHDLRLALRLGRELGVDIDRITNLHVGRRAIVAAIKEAVSDAE